jgi:hypothetical protein
MEDRTSLDGSGVRLFRYKSESELPATAAASVTSAGMTAAGEARRALAACIVGGVADVALPVASLIAVEVVEGL